MLSQYFTDKIKQIDLAPKDVCIGIEYASDDDIHTCLSFPESPIPQANNSTKSAQNLKEWIIKIIVIEQKGLEIELSNNDNYSEHNCYFYRLQSGQLDKIRKTLSQSKNWLNSCKEAKKSCGKTVVLDSDQRTGSKVIIFEPIGPFLDVEKQTGLLQTETDKMLNNTKNNVIQSMNVEKDINKMWVITRKDSSDSGDPLTMSVKGIYNDINILKKYLRRVLLDHVKNRTTGKYLGIKTSERILRYETRAKKVLDKFDEWIKNPSENLCLKFYVENYDFNEGDDCEDGYDYEDSEFWTQFCIEIITINSNINNSR